MHPAWQVTAMCLGMLVGVAVAQWLDGVAYFLWIVVAGCLLVICLKIGRRWTVVFAIAAGLLIGLWRGGIAQQQLAVFEPMIGQHIRVSATVLEDPDTNKRGELVLRIGRLSEENRPLAGELWVTTKHHSAIQRSDRLVVDGKLSPGFGSLTASIKNAQVLSVKREQPGDIALSVRNNFSTHIEQGISGSAASLGEGYLLGQKRGLPDDLTAALRIAGLTHVVVASGYNLTILVRLARRLFEKVSKFLSFFSATLMVGGFMAVTGLSPSMVRAGLVSMLALTAWYYGRRFHPVVLLSIAGAVTVLVDPTYAWGNLGWELSFAAFAGVMILAPLIHAYFYGNDKPHAVIQILIETISAQIMTLPIILVTFGQLSIVAPLANLIILPFVPLAMLLTFIAGLAAYIVPFAATIVAWPAQTLLDIMIAVVHWCANLSWAQMSLVLPWWGAVIAYVGIGVVCVVLWRVTGYRLHRSSIVE